VSSAGWFKRAKAALALTEYMDRLLLFAPESWHGPSVLSVIEQIPAADIKAEGLALVKTYRHLAVALPVKTLDAGERRRGRTERRARTDPGRDSDARDAVPARPW